MGKYFYAEQKGKTFIRLVGEMRYSYSGGFDAFLEELFERDFGDVLIDLTETTYIDSTNLGLLARIAENLQVRYGRKPTIVCPNRDICSVLHDIGFDSAFLILEGFNLAEDFSEVTGAERSDLETAEMMIAAHKSLIRLSSDNETAFRDVVRMMEAEVEQHRLDTEGSR